MNFKAFDYHKTTFPLKLTLSPKLLSTCWFLDNGARLDVDEEEEPLGCVRE